MKKTFAVICMAVMCCSSAMAQLSWGLRGGLNLVDNDITNVSSEGVKSADSYTGYFIGPMAELQIPVIGLGVDAAILYQQKGMDVEVENADADVIKQQQIAVPVYLKYTFGLGNMLGIFAQAGPQFNYNIGDLEQDIMDGTEARYVLNQSTWSFNLGAGAKLLNHFQAAINYNIPLSKEGALEVEMPGAKKTLAKLKQSTLQFSVTYTF